MNNMNTYLTETMRIYIFFTRPPLSSLTWPAGCREQKNGPGSMSPRPCKLTWRLGRLTMLDMV